MVENDLNEKISKTLLRMLHKSNIVINITLLKYFFVAMCTTNVACIYFMYYTKNKQIEQQDKNETKIEIIEEKINEIALDCKKKTEILLSLLKLNDNLFSDVIFITNQIRFIRENIGEINHILTCIVPINKDNSEKKDEYSVIYNYKELTTLIEDSPSITDSNISPKTISSNNYDVIFI
jgi:hypothetical protein